MRVSSSGHLFYSIFTFTFCPWPVLCRPQSFHQHPRSSRCLPLSSLCSSLVVHQDYVIFIYLIIVIIPTRCVIRRDTHISGLWPTIYTTKTRIKRWMYTEIKLPKKKQGTKRKKKYMPVLVENKITDAVSLQGST